MTQFFTTLLFIFFVHGLALAGPQCDPNKLKVLFTQSKKAELIAIDTMIAQKNSTAKINAAIKEFQATYGEFPLLIDKVSESNVKNVLVLVKDDGTWLTKRKDGGVYEIPQGSSTFAIQKRLTDPAHFHIKARADIQNFPQDVRRELGKAIFDLQNGVHLSMPLSRHMPSVGPGVSELRVRTRQGNYRVFYYTDKEHGVVVFHTFTKKTEQTPPHEIDIGRKRLREMLSSK